MVISPSLATVNHRVFESQALDQRRLSLKPVKELNISQDVLSRFLDLTVEEAKIILTVCKYDRIDAKTIGSKTDLSRYRALQKSKKLIDRRIFKSEPGTKPSSGAKATFYFSLADGLDAETVNHILRSTFGALAGESTQTDNNGSTITHRRKKRRSSADPNNAPELFEKPKKQSQAFWLQPPFSSLLQIIGQAPDGITAKEIEHQIKCRKQTLNLWLRQLLDAGQVKRKASPYSSTREYLYYLEGQELEHSNTAISSPISSKYLNTQVNEPFKPISQQSSSVEVMTEFSEEMDVWAILEALVDRVCDLEDRLYSIEQIVRDKKVVRSEKIQAFLRRS